MVSRFIVGKSVQDALDTALRQGWPRGARDQFIDAEGVVVRLIRACPEVLRGQTVSVLFTTPRFYYLPGIVAESFLELALARGATIEALKE